MPATSVCTLRRLVVLAGVVLTVAACGGGSGSPTAPAVQTVPPASADVDLSGVTPGYTAPAAGTFRIAAGLSLDRGDVTFTCAAGGADCTVTVAADGTVTATGGTVTATGGTVTAINSAAWTMGRSVAAQRQAADTAIRALETAVGVLSAMSTDAEVAAAEAAVAAAKAALDAAAVLPAGEVTTLHARIAAVETTLAGVRSAVANHRRHLSRLPFPPRVECDVACGVTDGEFIAGGHYAPYHQANARADVGHAPVYVMGGYLRVGIDQGLGVGALQIVGDRGETVVRHGILADGVGGDVLGRYLDESQAERYFDIGPGVFTVTGTTTRQQEDWIAAAVRLVKAALPSGFRMQLAGRLPASINPLNFDGAISIEFVPPGSLGGNAAGRTSGRISRDASGEIRTVAQHILLDRGAYVFRGPDADPTQIDLFGVDHRRPVILIAHELLHALGISGHVSPDFDTIMAANADLYMLRQDQPQPSSLLYPIDREAMRRLYGDGPEDLGAWASTATHIVGTGVHAAFGVAQRNGYAEPWAYGLSPNSDLVDNPALPGTARWTGTLLGITPQAASVAGDASIGVDLATLDGTVGFTSLEQWNGAPGEAGTGATWLDGDLAYTIAVTGNAFRETGGDAGMLTGIFTGPGHEGAAGTLERADLTAAFGATFGPPL